MLAPVKDCCNTQICPGDLVEMLPLQRPLLMTPGELATGLEPYFFSLTIKPKTYFLYLRNVSDEHYSALVLPAKKDASPVLEILYNEKVYWICCNTAFMKVCS